MKIDCYLLFILAYFMTCISAYRNVVRPKHETTTSEQPRPWRRTIYTTKIEIVTPTVIAGVTFSSNPGPTSNPLAPWISLNNKGEPKTIMPKLKDGRTINGSPTYSTYFQTAVTHTFSYEELKAHNMDKDEIYEEHIFLEEDKTYVSLNPLIRCTPDRYFNKGLSKDISSAPFCTPWENSEFKVDNTYFISWFTRFFSNETSGETIDKVRLHLSYVQEKMYDKGLTKRENFATFFSSEWINNVDGIYPLTILEDWLQNSYSRKAIVSIQPSHIPDDEFNPLDHGVVVNIVLGSRVFKTTKDQMVLEDAGISNDNWYYVALTIPTIVLFAIVCMYFFLHLSKNHRDFTDIKRSALNQKRRVLGKFKDMKRFKNTRNHKYEELPIFQAKTSKQN